MKEIKKEDIALLKLVCLNMKKTILNEATTKTVDAANEGVVNIFNFEQRLIDLIEEKLKHKDVPKDNFSELDAIKEIRK